MDFLFLEILLYIAAGVAATWVAVLALQLVIAVSVGACVAVLPRWGWFLMLLTAFVFWDLMLPDVWWLRWL